MTNRPKRCTRVAMKVTAALIVASFLLVTAPPASGFLGRLLFGGGRVGNAYDKTLKEAAENTNKAFRATIRGNEEEYRKHAAKVFAAPAQFARDAGPLGPVYDALESVAATTERVTKKISRIFGGGDGNARGGRR